MQNQSAVDFSIILTILVNLEFGLLNKFWGVSNSAIYPLSTTIILSEFITVLILCAIVITIKF